MSWLSYIGLLAGLLFVARLLNALYRQTWLSPLKNFPGPWLWSVSAVPYYLSTIRGTSHREIMELHRKYGDVVRIAPTQLSYANEMAWRDVWAHRPGHQEFQKGSGPVPVNGVQGILGAGEEAHRKYRRAFSHAFSAQGLREQQPRIDRFINLLVHRLDECGALQPVDLVAWFHWTTFDIIGDLAFGSSFDCLESASTHRWIADILGNLASTVWLTAGRELGFTWAVRWLVPRRLLQARLENHKFVVERMAARTALGSSRGDFFDRIVALHEREEGLSQEEIESNASNIVLAGSETTATMLSGVVALLLEYPDVMNRLTRHLRERYGAAELITPESCARDQYLLACLSEAMRLYPSVPTFSSRIVPYRGDYVGTQLLPGGTRIHFSHVAAYRFESNFTRPDDFVPERWVGDAEFVNDNRGVFQPFAVGPRDCIGKNLAYAETRVVVARLLWTFNLTAFPQRSAPRVWIDSQKTYVLWQKPPLLVNIRRGPQFIHT